jgi:hypothetical protein
MMMRGRSKAVNSTQLEDGIRDVAVAVDVGDRDFIRLCRALIALLLRLTVSCPR